MKQSLTKLLEKKMEDRKEGGNKKKRELNPMLQKESQRMWQQCEGVFWEEK